jgi:16S rRNA (guanine966-N2)-methyltransferase
MGTRPTSDKVKGAIFNILGDKVINASVLDLFAGTGNLSWEALSRGAVRAVLVEKNFTAVETIRDNMELLGAQTKARLFKMDAIAFLQQNPTEKFNLIFLDPPYHQGLVSEVVVYLRSKQLLQPNGVIIAETASDEEINGELFPFEVMITREYGDTKLWFLQRYEEPEEVNFDNRCYTFSNN